MHGRSLVAASRGCSSLWWKASPCGVSSCGGLHIAVCLLLWSTGSGCAGFSSCSTQTQYLWHVGLVAPWYVEYPQTRDQVWVPCIDRLILIHCATREIRVWLLLLDFAQKQDHVNEFLSHDKHHVRKQRVSWCQGPLCGSPELLFSSFPPKINAILIYNMNWLSEAICGFHIKWNHMLCLSLCLTSFNQQYVSENHMSWCI